MITEVHHVGLVVRDLEGARAFYGHALGLPALPGTDPHGRPGLLVPVGRSALAIRAAGADGREGLEHLCLAADGVADVWARLRAVGVLPAGDGAPPDGLLSPDAMDGLRVGVSVAPLPEGGPADLPHRVLRIDHVVIRAPDPTGLQRRFADYFGVETRRTMERPGTGAMLAFLRPGEVILELARPRDAAAGPAALSGLAFAVAGLDALVERLRGLGYPVGEPHPAVQPGARIAALGREHACGVPVAFLEFA